MNKRCAYFSTQLKTRAEPNSTDKYIEGYFIVFNQPTELWCDCLEQIAPEAVEDSLKNNDIRCLFNHNDDIVLGRTLSKTLELRTDAHGLWGRVKINENDNAAMDAYSRVERGDISGCSFGFVPITEEYTTSGNQSLCTVRKADIFEISVCAFPAYPQTEIQARKSELSKIKEESIKIKKSELSKRLEAIK